MGAFLLSKIGTDTSAAEEVFRKKGLRNPKKSEIGNWRLTVYPKISEKNPQVFENESRFVVIIGTAVYKELGIIETGNTLLKDFCDNKLDTKRLFGHYTIIYFDGFSVYIMMDPLRVKHVYCSIEFDVFSSSLLAICAMQKKVCLNKNALIEKLITGIIISPDTIVQEVVQVNHSIEKTVNEQKGDIKFISCDRETVGHQYSEKGLKQNVIMQDDFLLGYLREWNQFIRDAHAVDLGLSAGYDSTLLFSLLLRDYKEIIHIHTHSTGKVHDHEKKAAIAICKKKEINCNVVATERLNHITDDITNLLIDNIYYFDGMTSIDIGGFSQTYTNEYRMKATEASIFTMTGVGGELYRNKYGYKKGKTDFLSFAFDRFFSEGASTLSSNPAVKQAIDRHISKAEGVLGCSLTDLVPSSCLRRYYSEILMPEGQGHVIDAFNTVSFCIGPFLEKTVIDQGYRSLDYHGSFGKFEAMMIENLDAEIAGCMSSYGYVFNRVPFKTRIKEYLRSRISKEAWKKTNKKVHKTENAQFKYYQQIMQKNTMLAHSVDRLSQSDFGFDLNTILQDRKVIGNFSYIALLCEECSIEID